MEFTKATLVATFDTPEGIWFIEDEVVAEIFDHSDTVARFVRMYKMYAEAAILDIPRGGSLREIQLFPLLGQNRRIYWYEEEN